MDSESWDQAWANRDVDPVLAERLIDQTPTHPYARIVLTYLQWRAGFLKTAQATLAPVLLELQQKEASLWYGRALNTAACLSYSLNQVDEALMHLERQVQIARSCGDMTLEATGLHDLAVMLRIVHPARAEQYLHKALEMYETVDDPLGKPLVYLNLGNLQQDAGCHELALEYYTLASSFPGITLQPTIEADCLSAITAMLELLNRPADRHDIRQRLQILADTYPHPEVQAQVWLSLTRCATPEDVIIRLSHLPPLLETEDMALYLPIIYERLSKAYTQLGDNARALENLQLSLHHERAVNSNQRQYVARAFESLLLLEEAQQRAVQLEQLNQHMARLSYTDHLTRLANRVALFKQVEQWAVEHVTLSVALFDIDWFKRINDTWGHNVGDAVLVQVAHVLQKHADASDVVARYGGEEFVLVRPTVSSLLTTCQTILEDIRQLRFEEIAPDLTVTLSVGVACPGQDFQQLLEQADQKLYAVKRNGKNAVAG